VLQKTDRVLSLVDLARLNDLITWRSAMAFFSGVRDETISEMTATPLNESPDWGAIELCKR
jgi:hypothetical protein